MGKYRLTDELCSVPGCTEPIYSAARKLCCKHVARLRRHGDPLAGGPKHFAKRGEPERFYQEVVLAYDGQECLIWPYRRTKKDGYAAMTVSRQAILVQRRLCTDVYGPPTGQMSEAAHRCGKGHLGCVAKNHLRWATPQENSDDKKIHGTIPLGEDSPAAKLTRADVLYLRSLPSKYDRRAEAARLGVSPETISTARVGKTWGHIAEGIIPRRSCNPGLRAT